MEDTINTGNTAWVLMSAALVLVMTPGLAMFYGGMVRAKSVLNMLMMCFLSMGIVTIIWVTVGFSLTFGTDSALGLIGNFEYIGLNNTIGEVISTGVPLPAFAMFQLTFGIITAALVAGAVADRVKISAWIAFISLWALFVYIPIAHWAFAFDDGAGGWIGDRLGALDFAGGTAVEINSGFSALALAIVVGKRLGWHRDSMRPHNLPLVLLGAGMLWFGWFGFNAGSALAADGLAANAMINTQVATATAALGWVLVERIRNGKPTTLGIASGAIAGAVAITPSCGFVNPMGALVIGLAAGSICALAVELKHRFGYDDSLDVLGVHGIGGIVGMVGIGFLATTAVNAGGADGLFFGGGTALVGKQVLASIATMAYAFAVTWILAMIVDKTIGLRITPAQERAGIDISEHAETAYEFSDASVGSFSGTGRSTGPISQLHQREEDQ
jgi:Amt family ammonium transporter